LTADGPERARRGAGCGQSHDVPATAESPVQSTAYRSEAAQGETSCQPAGNRHDLPHQQFPPEIEADLTSGKSAV